jgi:cation diffusion facilitator CzcD-associated flavoprotein CzcO
VLERAGDIGGCWLTEANEHSHVTVCEASFRFPLSYPPGETPSQYTPREEILSQAQRFAQERNLGRLIRFNTSAASITPKGPIHLIETQPSRGPPHTIRARAVFICTGAQVPLHAAQMGSAGRGGGGFAGPD